MEETTITKLQALGYAGGLTASELVDALPKSIKIPGKEEHLDRVYKLFIDWFMDKPRFYYETEEGVGMFAPVISNNFTDGLGLLLCVVTEVENVKKSMTEESNTETK